MNSNDGEFLREAAMSGRGVFFAPLFWVEDALQAGALVRLMPSLAGEPLPVNLIYRIRRLAPQRLRVFVDHRIACR